MEKKRINKLMIPLTIRSASILSAFTIMATSIGGCAPKKDKKDDEINTSVITSSNVDEELTNNSDVITSSEIDEPVTEEKNNESSTTKENNSKSNNTTTNKPNDITKNNHNNNNNNTANSNTNNSNQNNNNNVNDEDRFVPLTPNNINDIPTFERAVMEVSRKTRGGFGGIWGYNYNGQVYTSYGLPFDELKYVLAALNKDYLSNDMLNSLLGSYNEDEIKRFYRILGPMIGFVEDAQCQNNWDGLIIDPKILNEFKSIEKAFLDYRFNNNPNPLTKLVYEYDMNTTNPLVGFYITAACDYATRNSSIKADEDLVDKYIDLINDIKPECEKLAENMYAKLHGKAKILE